MPALALEISVGHRPADGDRGAVDARLLVVLAVEDLGVVVVVLGPVQIHPQEHLGPVVGVGAAVAGVDRQQGGVGVQRPAQQGLGFQDFDALAPGASNSPGTSAARLVVLLGHLDQRRPDRRPP